MTGGSSTDPRFETLERRIGVLEARNEALENRFERILDASGLSRRQALSVLVGGGALAGAGALYLDGTNGNGAPSTPASSNGADAGNASSAASPNGADAGNASNQSRPVTAGAIQYVSPNDDLASALDRASEGDTIALTQGKHVVDSTLRRDVDDLTLFGYGRNATTITRSGDFPVLELVGTDKNRRTGWTFSHLGFSTEKSSEADLIRSKKTSSHSFFDVFFNAGETTGNGIYCNEAWDWNFERCYFDRGGTQSGGADVYLYNGPTDNSNQFDFVDCRFEPALGHAIYLDSSGGGSMNGRLRVANCKFHGQQPEDNDDPDAYRIDGSYNVLAIVNCHFIWSKQGFIRHRNGSNLQVSNCFFQFHDGPAINVQADGASLIGNTSYSNFHTTTPADRGEEAILVAGSYSSVVGNVAHADSGIRITGSNCAAVGNVVRTPAADPLTVSGTNVDAVANITTTN